MALIFPFPAFPATRGRSLHLRMGPKVPHHLHLLFSPAAAPPSLLASLSLSSSPSICISIPLCTPIHSCISIPSYLPTPACLPIPHSCGAVMLQVGQWAAVLGDHGWLQHLPRGALLHLSLVALALGRAHPSLTPLGSVVPGEGAKAASPWPRLQSPDPPHCTNDAQIGA